MNKKQKIYIGILVVLIIVFLITKMGNNVEKRINFFQVDSTKIKTIEISNIKDTLRLSKQNDMWKIVYPFENDANEYQIKNIFSKVLKVKTSNLPISESESSFDTYKVTNSQGTWIKFIDENKIKTGSYGVSEKDVINSIDIRKEALQKFAVEFLRFGSTVLAIKIASKIDPTFKVREDKTVAVNALYSLCPSVVPYIEFKKGWRWVDLRVFLIDLGLISE